MYVANFAYNSVIAITTGTNAIAAVIPVGTNPWAMAETPDGHKLYVVNNGSNDVTSINTADRSVVVPTLQAGPSPQWAQARSDSHRVYVLASDGTVTDIDSEFTSGTVDTVLAVFHVSVDTGLPVIATNSFFYDSRLNRLHIPFMTPAASGGVLYEDAIYNAAVDPPSLINVVPVRGPVPAPCLQCVPIAVTALQDGTRAYVASYAIDTNTTNCNSTQVVGYPAQNCIAIQVAVLNELNNTVSKVVSLPEVALSPVKTPGVPPVLVTTTVDCSNPGVTRFRLLTTSSTDSTRVDVASCDVGGVATIRTTDDTYVTTVKAPVSLLDPIQYGSGGTAYPPPQSPLFLISGP
jgi:YVTN family beta-propeller protein